MGTQACLVVTLALLCTSLPTLFGLRELHAETSSAGHTVSQAPLQVGGAVSSGYEAPIGTWRRARTSWYGTPDWVKPYAATRGGGIDAFGILPWGGCGYTNGNGDILFTQDEAAAYSDDNPDWPGTCGRCYEVRCVPGPVVGPREAPIPLEELYYYPKFLNQSDEMGRPFPGNPAVGDNYQSVTCWDTSVTTVVKIVDLCPCYYCPAGQDCRYQESCCYKRIDHPKSGQISLDVSFWAFQKLAHPAYGIMMVDYRPVDCGSHKPLEFIPGFINKHLYTEMVGEGWAWFAYKTLGNNFNVSVGGLGVGGSKAACAEVAEGGAQTFWARGAGVPAFEPLAGVDTLSFSIKDLSNPGQVPPLRIVLSGDYSLPTNAAPGALTPPMPTQFCERELYIQNVANVPMAGGYLRFDIPVANFKCPIEKINKIDFMATSRTTFCLDDVRLVPKQHADEVFEVEIVAPQPTQAAVTDPTVTVAVEADPQPEKVQAVVDAATVVSAQSGDHNPPSDDTQDSDNSVHQQSSPSAQSTHADTASHSVAAEGGQAAKADSGSAEHSDAAEGGQAVGADGGNVSHSDAAEGSQAVGADGGNVSHSEAAEGGQTAEPGSSQGAHSDAVDSKAAQSEAAGGGVQNVASQSGPAE